MKNIRTFFLLLSILFSTSTLSAAIPPGLRIEWQLITNNYENSDRFLSEIKIINEGRETLQGNWELYFSFSPCRDITAGNIHPGLLLTHINGDLHKLETIEGYSPVDPGKTLNIKIISTEWAIKETDAPDGFYFIFDKDDSNPYFPILTVHPFKTGRELTRNQNDGAEIPTAESIYKDNQRLSLLLESALCPITPTPAQLIRKDGTLALSNTTRIYYDTVLENEAVLLQILLKNEAGIEVQISEGKPVGDDFIHLTLDGSGKSEAYNLISGESGIVIRGGSESGVFYGIQSLRSLLPVKVEAGKQVLIPALGITDQPRFAYRGIHLDVSRNFQSKESVFKLLEAMSFYKLNKLHFHLTDDEGWRVEIPGIPELTQIGGQRIHTRDESEGLIHQYGSATSTSGSGFYSREDYIEILRFAKERYIEVIPEIDMPGHARAAIVAMKARYHKYFKEGNFTEATKYMLHDADDESTYISVQNFNDNVVCPCQESTYTFIDKVVKELVSMHLEADAPLKTMHTGGDEVPHGVWEKSPVCNSMVEHSDNGINNLHDVKDYFLKRFADINRKYGINTAGWEEIAMHVEADADGGAEKRSINTAHIDENFVPYIWNSVIGWGGEELGYKLANAGYKVVLCNVTHLYLDMSYNKHPMEPGFYWGGFITEEEPYLFDPLNIYKSFRTDAMGNKLPDNLAEGREGLTLTGQKNILGIQGQLWTETVKTPEAMEQMIFPRLISVAERAWAAVPEWTKDQKKYGEAWNEFANRLGQKELPRLNHLAGGLNYHLPMPGAIIINDVLYANVSLPGVTIRFTTDGSLPTQKSQEYKGPVKVIGNVKLCTFDQTNRKSIAVETIAGQNREKN